MYKTRKESACPIFGIAQELSQVVLPTYEDVIKCYLSVRDQLKPKTSTKEPEVRDISEIVASSVEMLWLKATLSIISHTRVVQLIRSYHDTYTKLKRNMKRNNTEKFDRFRVDARSKLFDIAACKCRSFDACNCEKSRKIPAEEQLFLQDQRTMRTMYIGSVDKVASKKILSRLRRKAQEEAR